MAATTTCMISLLLVMTAALDTGDALQCYQCTDLETSSSSSLINQAIALKTDPGCESLDTVATVTCPNSYSYKCGFIKGDITIKRLGMTFDIKARVRGCLPVDSDTPNSCVRDPQVAKNLNKFLKIASFVTDVSSLDGDICYCDTDLCNPACGNFALSIGNTCLSWWVIIGVAGGIVVLIILCCVCCCCCCCRRSPPTRFVQVPSPGVLVVSSAAPAVGGANGAQMSVMTNAGYDQSATSQPHQPVYGYNQPGQKC